MKKVIVTGGAGFIGSNLVDRLIDMGVQVTIMDNFSTGKVENVNPSAYYWKVNIATVPIKDLAVFMDGVDVVFHMAAEPRIQVSIENPIESLKVNILGTTNVLEAARIAGVGKVIYSSTCAAYGLQTKLPFTEDMKTDCLNTYSISKVAGEDMCKMYSSLFDLETITFRYFNVYGNRQPTSGQYAPVISIFTNQHNNNEPMTIVGDGLQTRDYINVSDVVEANIVAGLSTKEFNGEIYNIGTGQAHSILDIAKMFSDNYIHLPKRQAECRYVQADVSKVAKALNWKAKINLKEWIGL